MVLDLLHGRRRTWFKAVGDLHARCLHIPCRAEVCENSKRIAQNIAPCPHALAVDQVRASPFGAVSGAGAPHVPDG